MWKRGEIRSNFSSFPHYFIHIFLASGVKLHIHLLNMVFQFIVFLTLSTLICQSTDISKCFSESLGIRDNKSRLYVQPCLMGHLCRLHFLICSEFFVSKGNRFDVYSQLVFYVNLHRAVIGPSATLTGRWRPDIDLRRMLTGFMSAMHILIQPCL